MFLAIFFTLGMFSGCGNNGTDNSGSIGVDDGIFSIEDVIYIDKSGESVYTIIRSDNGDSSTSGIVFKAIKNNIGVNAKNTTDTSDGADKYEILIGDTNRPETAKVKEYFKKRLRVV